MPEAVLTILTDMTWPVAIAIAWIAGEAGYRWLSLPRISSYGVAGFLMATSQGGFLANPSGGPVALLADFAFALILFELGYRINLRWLRADPWLGVTSVVEAAGTFAAVFMLAQVFAVPVVPSLLLAALAMSTSPASVPTKDSTCCMRSIATCPISSPCPLPHHSSRGSIRCSTRHA